MAGTGKGIATLTVSGVRVAHAPTYIPEHLGKDGKKVDAQLKVTAGVNRKKDAPATYFDFEVWGPLADVCAKCMNVGKEFNARCTPKSFKSKIYNENRQPICNSKGEPMTVLKTYFKVEEIALGAESEKTIGDEITANKRPADWDIVGSPGHTLWRSVIEARKTLVYDGQAKTYGYANVFKRTSVATPAAAPLQNQVAGAVDANRPF